MKLLRWRAVPPLLCSLPIALGCGGPVRLGSDLVWTAEHEQGTLDEWLADSGGDTLLAEASTATVSTERAHRGNYAVKLVNPADFYNEDDGAELYRVAGPLDDAYYSAWFLLPELYQLAPSLTLMRLRSRDPSSQDLFSGEELQLRNLASGEYVLMVFQANPSFLREPIANPPPLVSAGRWFQLEARYEPRSGGRLRVWLDGRLAYDLQGRPGAEGSEVVMSLCNVAEKATPEPVSVFVDDAAVSLTRVSPDGALAHEP